MPGICIGNTPARAGPAETGFHAQNVDREHPRPCGACLCALLFALCSLGTPPPVQGLVPGVHLSTLICGNTPARAGPAERREPVCGARNTPARAGPASESFAMNKALKEHPRPCGACAVLDQGCREPWGTPPPVRGLRGDRPERPPGQRNTPARAGPALVRAGPPEPRGEHPHPCGACCVVAAERVIQMSNDGYAASVSCGAPVIACLVLPSSGPVSPMTESPSASAFPSGSITSSPTASSASFSRLRAAFSFLS